jgi:SAM-dependent methyltransferase
MVQVMTHAHDSGQGHAHDGGHGHGHGHGHSDGKGADFAGAAELLDLDAEVFSGYLADVVALAAAAVPSDRPLRVADLGCGSGTGTLALLERLPEAHVTALDVAVPLLNGLAARAALRGSADRLVTRVADLDAGWPDDLTDLDLVWASTSLHHVADPPARLADVRSALAPGGALVLVEIDDVGPFQPTFLADDGLETRIWEVVRADLARAMPYHGADWGRVLADAGFTIATDRLFDIRLAPPLPESVSRLAVMSVQRLMEWFASGTADRLRPQDAAALAELAGDGPGSVVHRELAPRALRHVWVARPRGLSQGEIDGPERASRT